jgi:hypothetical protein
MQQNILQQVILTLTRSLPCIKYPAEGYFDHLEVIMHDIGKVELLTTEELSGRIKYDPRYIREQLKDSVFIEGVHYIRPFGRRKILFVWETIEQEMMKSIQPAMQMIPLSAGGSVHG